MSRVTCRQRYCVMAATTICITAFVFCRLTFFVNAAEPAVTATVGELTDAERTAITSELQLFKQRLAELKTNPAANLDHWADADIFIKGIVWALEFGPIEDAKDRELLQTALRRAQERIESLATVKPPWAEKKGTTIRGFISEVDGSTQPYGLRVPASYDSSTPMRLDIVLHGSTRATGIAGLKFIRAYDGGDHEVPNPPAVDYIEMFPMGRLGENAYRFEGETDVDEAIAAVCRNYRIDKARMVLRGSSLGGVGTWQLGLKRPDRYVALGPAAGPVDTFEFANSPWPHFVRLDPLTSWQKTMLHLVDAIDYTANARMVPVVAVMGDLDPYISSHLLMQKAFEKEGISWNGIVDQGAGHGVSAKVMQQQLDVLGEYAAKGLDPRPRHIHFVTWTLKFSRCHWIEILGLQEHYQRTQIDAKIAEDGSISVTDLRNITRFAIRLEPDQRPPLSLTIAGKEIAVPNWRTGVACTLVFELKNDTWYYQGQLDSITLTGKRPGLQGPIDDAFETPFLCVRGTGTPWHPAVGDWADANLKRFADEWRRHYRGDLPIKNDTEVTEEDLRRCNLILFGDPGSNRWIKETLPGMPVKWTREEIQVGTERHGAVDHGLQMICPNRLPGAGDRYVVFNSGHTYHDSELRFSYMVFPRLGDWAITKVGENPEDSTEFTVDETVLQSGFLDEAWTVPPALN
jgi:poly(3-hydroxybutyrate) depolymerase